jgi:hypothetical protein
LDVANIRDRNNKKDKMNLNLDFKNPDNNVGVYLRQNSSVHIYNKKYAPSRFFTEAATVLRHRKASYLLLDYLEGDRYQPRMKFRRRGSLRLQQPYPRPSDWLNLMNDTHEFYRMTHAQERTGPAKAELQHKTKQSAHQGSQESLETPEDFKTVATFENSIETLNKISFFLPTLSNKQVSSAELTLAVSESSICFGLRYRNRDNKTASSTFELKLDEHLWILKEKFLLANPKVKIKTHNAVIFDLLLSRFFQSALSAISAAKSFSQHDYQVFDEIKRRMAIKFPLAMTKMNEYDKHYTDRLGFAEYNKNDMDSLQALVQIVYYLASIGKTSSLRNPVGGYPMKYFDLNRLVREQGEQMQLINTLFMLQMKAGNIQQQFTDSLQQLFYTGLYRRDTLSQIEHISLPNIQALLEKLLYLFEYQKNLGRASESCLRVDESGENLENHLYRKVVLDSTGAFNWLDLSIKLMAKDIRVHSDRLAEVHSKMNKELSATGSLNLGQNYLLLYLFFLILEKSLRFSLRIESPIEWTLLKIVKKQKKARAESKKEHKIAEVVIEVDPNKPDKQEEDTEYMALSELYFLYKYFLHEHDDYKKLNDLDCSLLDEIKNNWAFMFRFLIEICVSPLHNVAYKLVTEGLGRSGEQLWYKHRSFYRIKLENKQSWVTPIHLYRFRYSHLRLRDRKPKQGLLKDLQGLVSKYSAHNRIKYQYFNNFIHCFRLLHNDQTEDWNLVLAHRPAEEPGVLTEQKEMSRVANQPTSKAEEKVSVHNLFETNYSSVFNNLAKNHGVSQ